MRIPMLLRTKTLLIVLVFALAFAACGGGAGDAVSTGSPTVTVSVAANPSSVTSGGSSTVTWSSTNATSCTASGAWSGSKATSGNQFTGALTASSNYSLTCTSSGGSGSASATVTVQGTPPPPPPGSQNFPTRCNQPGVLRCVGFDSASDIAGGIGSNSGILPGDAVPALDATLNASGGTGSSLKFVIPAKSAANSSGFYWINFSNDLLTQFGENSDFYVQWRQRFSAEFINTVFAGGGGWKQAIIGEGDNPGCTPSNSLTKDSGGFCASSCTQLEIVTQNTFQRGIAQMYHSCGVKDGQYQPLDVVTGGSTIHLQYATPSLTNCNYPGPYTTANCIPYKADQWMTFQVHVKVGTWYKNNLVYHGDTAIHLWIAEEGQASRLAMERDPGKGTGYDLVNLSPSISQYGKVWLLPYHTGKDSTVTNPVAYTWYDELIISRTQIADPAP